MSDYTPTKDRIVSWLMEGAYTGQGADHRAEAFDTWLAEHDAKVRAEEREKAAQIAEEFDPVEAALAGRYAGKDIAARIREQGKEQGS